MTFGIRFIPAALVLAVVTSAGAHAALTGTSPLNPGDTIFVTQIPSGVDPGTLLASETVPFTTSINASGVLVAAVFREASGTLDFYYQISDNASSIDSLARETNTDFTGFSTAVGYRTDGGTLLPMANPFVNGSVPPVFADRNAPGDVVGFSFNQSDATKIQPGQTSNVLVISTNATNFTAGHSSVIDGGTITVAAFQPEAAVPEPLSLLLLGGGLLALGSIRRFRS